jgi:CRISPR-associated endonuclease Csn1
MKKILGLDLGVGSVGWALVNEAESNGEKSSIIKMGVRVINYDNFVSSDTGKEVKGDPGDFFSRGKGVSPNKGRTDSRSMRRNLQRYKLRREELVKILKDAGFITDETILSEQGNRTTFETYRLRAKAATERISLEELARVLLMINKKRGYKSSRKAKGGEDGALIDGMEVAKKLYDEDLTPGQLCLQLMDEGKRRMPDFYRSDLQAELSRVWDFQQSFYPSLLTDTTKEEIQGKNRSQTWAILAARFEEAGTRIVGLKRTTKGRDLKRENYQWRAEALSKQIDIENLVIVLQEINGEIYSSSGYLGAISDRSKALFFNKQTAGQYLMESLDKDPHVSLKNMVFYRQDYLDEFECIWETQALYHPELTQELKYEIRDTIIFYQRRLKSQKSLIGFCEFESTKRDVVMDGKTKTITIGSRVIPRSSPLFQEFKVWQTLNNLEVIVKEDHSRHPLTEEEKALLAEELSVRRKLSDREVLKLLYDKPSTLSLNYEEVEGNTTSAAFYEAYSQLLDLSGHEPIDFKKSSATEIKKKVREVFSSLGWNTDILSFDPTKEKLDNEPYYKLWHLLYSFEGDNTVTGDGNLKEKVAHFMGFDKEYAQCFVAISFVQDYGSLSAKAIRNILPFLKEGNKYDVACMYAGYRHSAASLTKEEIESKVLKDKLEILPKGALRNPVVEKILNQMVNVINEIIDTYGRPDEIRVELARELKKNAKQREKLAQSIATATKEQEEVRRILREEFNKPNPSRNDVIRYRLYDELKGNNYKTLYSNTYIPRERLFEKDFDIEHIIPQALLFDDSFSNKTLEVRSINIEKGKRTAFDFVSEKYGEEELQQYRQRCESLFGGNKDKQAKLRKLLMSASEIPTDFLARDLTTTQYIAKKAFEMLGDISRRVVATTGSITDQLRSDWQLVDVMKELNWDKYSALGKVEYHQDRDGRQIGRISDWTKRNDHRHHAMDALTVAFTKDVFIQYYNNKNASEIPNSNEYAIKSKYFEGGRAIPPMPLGELRGEAKRHLQNILISIKAKNKVVTTNINKIPGKKREVIRVAQQTPRGQLHNETIYGSHKEYVPREEKIGAAFDETKIMTVCRKVYREALLARLHQFGDDAKKAFTGKNALDKNPIWIDKERGIAVPPKVKTVTLNVCYTVRKNIDESLSVDKVVDVRIRRLLLQRIEQYGSAKAAFANLDENPIWLNEEKGIKLKRVTINEGIGNAEALHTKRDKDGRELLDENENHIPVDFVKTGSNHHVAVYRKPLLDKQGLSKLDEHGEIVYELEERIVSFYEAVERANQGLPIIDKSLNHDEGWQFLFTMKQNEYFVFPNEQTGFDPKEVDLLNPDNYALISPNLFRVQKFSVKDYYFRHHLETMIDDDKRTYDVTWKRIRTTAKLDTIVKVRVNHIGQIVSVGEY